MIAILVLRRKLIALLDDEQTLIVWSWASPDSKSKIAEIKIQGERQVSLTLSTLLIFSLIHLKKKIHVNPEDPSEIMTSGDKSVNFYILNTQSKTLIQHVPEMNLRYALCIFFLGWDLKSADRDHKSTEVTYLCSDFLPNNKGQTSVT